MDLIGGRRILGDQIWMKCRGRDHAPDDATVPLLPSVDNATPDNTGGKAAGGPSPPDKRRLTISGQQIAEYLDAIKKSGDPIPAQDKAAEDIRNAFPGYYVPREWVRKAHIGTFGRQRRGPRRKNSAG